ncbi:MAG TPA: DUF922 domain-containing protein [Longimicrobium sp.]|nr:DUF922 domain-containing protein [Longimicrobium sp.]
MRARWMGLTLAVVLAATTASACGPAVTRNPAGVRLVRRASAEYVFYPVEGETARQLSESMRARRLRSDRGTALGLTRWRISWQARWSSFGGICRTRDPVVEAHIQVWLPRWDPPPTASPELVRQWNEFVYALSEHEVGHVDIALEARREVRSLLRGLTGSCSGIQARASAAVSRLLYEYRRRQNRFDERERQAADPRLVWPPRSAPAPLHGEETGRVEGGLPAIAALDSAGPLSAEVVSGCYRLAAPPGAGGTAEGEFWSAAVHLDTVVARRLGPTPLPFPDPARRAVVTLAPASPALTEDTLRVSTAWQIVPPDTLRIVRSTGFHGEVVTLRWQDGSFAGHRETFSDVAGRAPGPREPVQLVPEECPLAE